MATHQDSVMEAREQQASGAEPIVTRERTARPNNNSTDVNLTAVGREILEIEPGDDLVLDIYRDRIEVRKRED